METFRLPEPKEMVKCATRFSIRECIEIQCESGVPSDPSSRWVVIAWNHYVLNSDGEWEYFPRNPTTRAAASLKDRTQFDRKTAWRLAEEATMPDIHRVHKLVLEEYGSD